jgi:ketosteroid isomerase-like protein
MSASRTAGDARSAIDSANHKFMDAYIRGDAVGVASVYTVNGQLLPPERDVITGGPAIARFWQDAMHLGTRKLETIELEIHGEAAHEVGRYTVEAADGQVADAGKYIVLWKFEDGFWRMHRDIWTTTCSAV